MLRMTFDPSQDRNPVWTPDGKRITFASERAGKAISNIYWQRADGTGDPQRLTESKNQQWPSSWHPSGKFLAFSETVPQTNTDIMILPMEGDETSGWKPGKPSVFLSTRFVEADPAFSPDGHWLAYASSESGQSEVYVRPFPGPGGKWEISTGTGSFPTWSTNGKELFYRTADSRIMVVTYKTEGDTFRADKPRLWSETQLVVGGAVRNFDLHPDGQRFAVLTRTETQTQTKLDKITFIFNLFDELRRIAPSRK
jgi:serine/threonine-protein kinase